MRALVLLTALFLVGCSSSSDDTPPPPMAFCEDSKYFDDGAIRKCTICYDEDVCVTFNDCPNSITPKTGSCGGVVTCIPFLTCWPN